MSNEDFALFVFAGLILAALLAELSPLASIAVFVGAPFVGIILGFRQSRKRKRKDK